MKRSLKGSQVTPCCLVIDPVVDVCCRYPAQYVYPSTYLTTQGVLATIPTNPLPSPSSTASAAAATQYIDYSSAYASQFAAGGYEYSPYTTTAATGYGVPAAYTYAMPQQLAASGASQFAHFQSQQIPERL